MALQAIVFDCDGVLVDSEPLHYRAFQEVLRPFGLCFDYSQYLEKFIGFDDRETFIEAFQGVQPPLTREMLLRLIEDKARSLERILSGGIETFPGVVELVRHLADRGVPLAVASGALKHEVEGFIRALGLNGAFSAVVTADEVERSKPDPETYRVAVKRLGANTGRPWLSCADCMAIEDTPAGIRSAGEAGLFVLGVTNSFPADELREAHRVLSTLKGLDFNEMVLMFEKRAERRASDENNG